MKIESIKKLPERPDPLFDNTDEDGIDLSVRRVLQIPSVFQEETTFFRRKLELGLFPCVEQGTPVVAMNDSWSPLTLSRMDTGKNNIGMLVGRTRIQIMEHIIGVLAGLGIDADIFLRSSVFPFRAVSLPTKSDCGQLYVDALLREDATLVQGMRKTFTVAEPTRIDFENKRGSYAILLPAEGNHELIIDVMVSYSGAIATQRARVKVTEDVMQRYVAGARTPSYGFRRKLLHILDVAPSLQKIVNIDTSKTVSIDQRGIINPRTEYEFNGANLELLMHEVLDKLGAYGIPLHGGARFVGTIMVFATGHGHDLLVMGEMKKGSIRTLNV